MILFGDFFNRLSHAADLFEDDGLVEQKDMQLFMEPLVFIFDHLKESTKDIDQKLLRHVHLIIYHRNFKNIISLFKKFNIYVPDDDEMKKQYQLTKEEVEKHGWIRIEDEDITR